MSLTSKQKANLLDIIALIAERDMPSNNTEAMLVARSHLDQETVGWCVSVLFNENRGWLDYDEHPSTGERGYVLNEAFDAGEGLDKLYASFLSRPTTVKGAEGSIALDEDDEDPDDEWADIDEPDDDEDDWIEPGSEAD